MHDGFGRLVENRAIEDGANYIATDTAYDALGRMAATYNPSRMTNGQSDGLGYATTMGYDALGRVVNVKTADGSTTTTSYTGNQTTVTDPAGKSRQYTYNALGMLTKVVEDPSGLNYTTSYQYDVLGDLTQVTQGSEIRSFGYDSLGRLLWAVNPESGTINYRYDALGNLVWRDDNMGRQTCYSYDALNRVTQKIYFTGNYAAQGGNCAAVPGSAYLADSPTVSYSYDSANISYGMGRLAKVTNGISTTTILSYDAEGRPLASQQSTGGKTYNLFYGYDLSGALTSETYPSGRQITTQFDGAGREAKINGALGGQPSTYLGWISYAPHGGVGLMQYGNNVWQATNYNSRLQPYARFDVINNDINKLLRAECLYWSGSYNLTTCGAENHTDNNGNPRATVFWYGNGGTSVSASFNETFAYDGVNRLTGVVDNGGWSRYFAYDQYSNMWLCGWPGIAPNGSAPAANYCSQTPSGIFNNANQIIGRSYDGAGNMASLMGSNFSYDAENRITTAAQPGIGTVTYTYDGDGRRVMKAVSTGLQTVYVYDIGGKLVAEYSSGAVSVPPCHTCFLSSDHLGSTRLVTDENGNTVSRHDYIPFGEEIQANSGGRDGTFGAQDFVNQKFTGKERDAETGLDYFGARYMSSAQGRFTTVDPVMATASLFDPQSWNAYTYTLNNPLKYVDKDGQVPILAITAAVGAVVGGVAGGAKEYINQVSTSGQVTSAGRIWTAAGGGALAGGLAGLTLGIGTGAGAVLAAGAVETGLVSASSTVIGDFAQHRANDLLGLTNPGENETELQDTLVDATTAGLAGTVAGKLTDKLLPIPNVRKEIELLKFASRRSTRAAQIGAASRRAQGISLGNAMISNTTGSGIQQSSQSIWGGISSWLREWWFNHPNGSEQGCVSVSDSASGSRFGGCQ